MFEAGLGAPRGRDVPLQPRAVAPNKVFAIFREFREPLDERGGAVGDGRRELRAEVDALHVPHEFLAPLGDGDDGVALVRGDEARDGEHRRIDV